MNYGADWGHDGRWLHGHVVVSEYGMTWRSDFLGRSLAVASVGSIALSLPVCTSMYSVLRSVHGTRS